MKHHIETFLAQAGARRDAQTGAVSTPIYQTATFSHPELGKSTGYDYTRTGNPTRHALEETLAQLDGGHKAFAFSSGLAALDAVLHLFSPGDTILVTEDLYGGTWRLLERVFQPLGIRTRAVDTSSVESVRAAADGSVKGLIVESPTNPLLRVADLPALAAWTREQGGLLIVDNTFLTPINQQPIALGADLVVYSATKYLSGHNDVLAGAVVTARGDLSEKIGFLQNAIGAVLGPFDSWLVLRGLKTLALRMRRQEATAMRVAEWLSAQGSVKTVYYPGLPQHPGHDRLKAQAQGAGAMIAFEVDGPGRAQQVLARVKVFLFAESLGGVESLVTYPAVQTHADLDPAVRERLGINDRLLRLSIGIEEAGDLIKDLDQALKGGEE